MISCADSSAALRCAVKLGFGRRSTPAAHAHPEHSPPALDPARPHATLLQETKTRLLGEVTTWHSRRSFTSVT
jgi:hypothetical protein